MVTKAFRSKHCSVFFLSLLIFFQFACSSEPVKTKIKPSIKKSTALKKETVNEQLIQNIFRDFFGENIEVIYSGELVSIHLKEDLSLSDDELIQKILSLSLKVIEKIPQVNRLSIKSVNAQKELRQMMVSMQDTKQFLKGEISKPELVRRMQLVVEDTKESLRLKIGVVQNLDEKFGLLTKLFNLDPSSKKILAAKANALRDLRREVEAIEIYKNLIEEPGYEFFAYWNLGYCFDQVKLYTEAILAYQKALSFDPNQPLLMRQLAQVYLKQGQLGEAEQWLKQSEGIEKTDQTIWLGVLLLREQKKFKEAQDLLAKLKVEGDYIASVLYNQIAIDLDLKNIDSAKKRLAELATLDPLMAKELQALEVFSVL